VTPKGVEARDIGGAATDMLGHEDFTGAAIRNPNDPPVKQARDTAMYMVRSFEPFSVRGFHQPANRTRSVNGPLQQFFGITSVLADANRWA
jgi:hypothetical protein